MSISTANGQLKPRCG